MKCSKKKEDLARKIVMWVLAISAAIITAFVAIVLTRVFMVVLGALVFGLTFLLVGEWLMGGISFCKGDD